MACDLTLGRLEPCKSAVGGLKAVYFVNWGEMTGYTYTTGTDIIDAVTGNPDAFRVVRVIFTQAPTFTAFW